MNNPNDLETMRNVLLCDNDDDEDILLDVSETDEEEHVSGREGDSGSEMSAANDSKDPDNNNNSTRTYIAYLQQHIDS